MRHLDQLNIVNVCHNRVGQGCFFVQVDQWVIKGKLHGRILEIVQMLGVRSFESLGTDKVPSEWPEFTFPDQFGWE